MNNSQTFLITGGCGFLGSHLVRYLLKNNFNVVCFDNEFRGKKENLEHYIDSERLTIIFGDVRNKQDWNLLPKIKYDGIFHFAAINGTQNFYDIPEVVLDVNVLGTINALEYVKKHNIPYFAFASTPEAYGIPSVFPTPETEQLTVPDIDNPRWSYGASKIIGEVYCSNIAKKYGFKCSIIRFNNVYGPNDHSGHVIPDMIKKIISNKKFEVQGSGEETRSFCYVTDAIDGIMLIKEKQTKQIDIFNLGTNVETKIKDLILKIAKISNSDIIPQFIPKEKPGTFRRLPNIKKICMLGYVPKISLDEGLKRTFLWHIEQSNNF